MFILCVSMDELDTRVMVLFVAFILCYNRRPTLPLPTVGSSPVYTGLGSTSILLIGYSRWSAATVAHLIVKLTLS